MKISFAWLAVPLIIAVLMVEPFSKEYFKHEKEMAVLSQEQNLKYLSQDSNYIYLYHLVDADTIKLKIKK